MKQYALILVSLSCLLFATDGRAAPVPAENKNAIKPTLTLQVNSIDELLGSLKTTVKTFFPEFVQKDFEREIFPALDPSRIPGVAVNRPFGLYATIGEGLIDGDYSKTSVVALIPIADEKAFLGLLEKSQLPAQKDGDAYSISLPNAPLKVTLRFQYGYAYFTASSEKIDLKTLLQPKGFFDEAEKAALTLRIWPDRLPNDLKKNAKTWFSQIENFLSANSARPPAAIGGEFGLVRQELLLMTLTGLFGLGGQEMLLLALIIGPAPVVKMVLDGEADEIGLRLNLDAKTGIFSNEIVIEPKKGTAAAKWARELKPTKNEFAGIVGADSAANLLIQTPLFSELVKTSFDSFAKKGAKFVADSDLPKEVQTAAAEGFKALRRSIAEEKLDLAASLRGPDADGQFSAVAAVSLKDTSELEKSLRAVVPVVPKEIKDLIKLDAFKVNGVAVHEIAVGEIMPPDAKKVFGKSSVYVATAPNAVFISFGAQGKSIITEALTNQAGAKPAPLTQIEISGKRLVSLFKSLGAPEEAIKLLEGPHKNERQLALAIKFEGGERIVSRLEVGLAPLFAIMPKAGKTATAPIGAPPAK
jgi:hypothetical protein